MQEGSARRFHKSRTSSALGRRWDRKVEGEVLRPANTVTSAGLPGQHREAAMRGVAGQLLQRSL
jgi:hypothetical protein